MSIYDKLVGCVPANKTAAVVFGISKDDKDLQLTEREKRINELCEEMRNIDKCLYSIKNVNFIGNDERKKIVERKMSIQNTLRQLKNNQKKLTSMAFPVIFMKIAKQVLKEKIYLEIRDKTFQVQKELQSEGMNEKE